MARLVLDKFADLTDNFSSPHARRKVLAGIVMTTGKGLRLQRSGRNMCFSFFKINARPLHPERSPCMLVSAPHVALTGRRPGPVLAFRSQGTCLVSLRVTVECV